MRKKEAERQRSLDIERWLKNKFRQGFASMRDAFEAADTKKIGMVRRLLGVYRGIIMSLQMTHAAFVDAHCLLSTCVYQSLQVTHAAFVDVLNRFGLTLEREHLAEFLSRCNIEPTRTEVPYRQFLHTFQDRSEDGMPHKILTNPKHGYNRADSPSAQSRMTGLETQLMNMFQKDFLAMLGTFQ